MLTFLKKHRIGILFFCGTMLYFAANFQRVAIPGAVFNELQSKWQLSASQVTSFGACFMYIYAISQLFVGLLNDRWGGSRVIVLGGAVFTAGCFLFALQDHYYLLCTGRFLTGLGASAFYLGLVAEAIRYFKKNYSIVISLFVMTGYAGGIVANAPFSFAVEKIGLRASLVSSAVFALVFLAAFLFPFREIRKPAVRKQVHFSPLTFAKPLKKRHNWYIFLFSGLNWGLYYSIQTVIGKKYLEDFCGISTRSAALVLSVTGIISAVAGFCYAVGSKKLDDRRRPFCLLTGSMTFSVFSLLLILTALDCRNFIPAVLVCCLASTSSLSCIVIPLIKETNDSIDIGSSIAFSNFMAYLFVAIFGNVIGGILNLFTPQNIDGNLIYSREAYLTLFAVMTLCAGCVLYWAIRIRETGGRHLDVK